MAHCAAKGDLGWAALMQDWMLISAPLALTVYFVAFQDQFGMLLSWLTALID